MSNPFHRVATSCVGTKPGNRPRQEANGARPISQAGGPNRAAPSASRLSLVHALTSKLRHFVKLSSEDHSVLDAAACQRVRQLQPQEDLVREGDKPGNMILVLDGWACRYKALEDGRRQIMAFLLPGDLCDLNMTVLSKMDHSIGALTTLTVAEISAGTLNGEVALTRPRLAQALWWGVLADAAIQREWTVNLGRRTAFERLAHLLCELFLRLRAVGLTRGNTCGLPITQGALADATGLSTVHINRTLQELRSAGLIILRGKHLTIVNLEALQDAALFSPDYLHLDREGRHLDANES